jgi:hypothetical protein
MTQLTHVRLVVDDTPYACWEWHFRERNIAFLRGIDPQYFSYVALANAPHLSDEHKHRAALAIRIAYSQALEVLFALLGTLVQAPNCAFGWMLAYEARELRSLVSKIARGEPVHTRLKCRVTWPELARLVHSSVDLNAAERTEMEAGFAKAWSRFAADFLSDSMTDEYTSAKHGMRARLGGFTLQVGIEDVPGQPARPEAMKTVGASVFGTSFYAMEKLGPSWTNFRAREHSCNWVPENLINGLYLLSTSINNVVSKLRILDGDSDDCTFTLPANQGLFNAPWRLSSGVTHCNLDSTLEAKDIRPCSKEEVLGSYNAI